MIQTLIVMATFGSIYYSKETFFGSKAGETDISLTAGLISAIYNMTTEIQQQKITELELENVRSVFRELPGEKLFIITVDKRMDNDDADDMLDELASRFVDRYGDVSTDGMILNDFEPDVDEIVERRLWYNTVPKKLGISALIPMIAILFSAYWYPFILIQGQTTILEPLKQANSQGIVALVLQSILIGLEIILPLFISMLLLRKYPDLKLPFRFSKEFLLRPTRGGYSEVLPSWFLILPVFSTVMLYSVVRYGRGIQFALQTQPLLDPIDNSLFLGSVPIFWYLMYFFIFLYILTWYLFFPFMIGLITGNLSFNWFKANMIVISIAFLPFLFAQLLSGQIYLEFMSFHPGESIFVTEKSSLKFLFFYTFPINLFLFAFIFMQGVGISTIIKKNRERYPIAFGFAIFTVFAVQQLIFYVIFNLGYFFEPLFA